MEAAVNDALTLRELRQRLDETVQRESAVAEILTVINDPTADLSRVFHVMIEKATKLCSASYGYVWLYDGERARAVASFAQQPFGDWLRQRESVPGETTPLGQALLHHRVVHVVDATTHEGYERHAGFRELVDRGGVRTLLHVPLRKGGELLGIVTVYRQECRPFSEEQIALLERFAVHAVIAMENARLVSETREALEQQTATADILRVISQSPTDVQPVLAAIAKAAVRFCGANDTQIALMDGDAWFVAAHEGPIGSVLGTRRALNRETGPGRAMSDAATVHLPDIATLDPVEFAEARRLGATLGFKAALVAPMLRDGIAIGAVSLRRVTAGAFSDRQIALVESFASQAVIAIENTRLFSALNQRTADLQASLEYQTAISDVIQIISRSTFDLAPVLQTLAESAIRLCQADMGFICRREGDVYRVVAAAGATSDIERNAREYQQHQQKHPLVADRSSLTGRVVLERGPVQIEDVTADPEYRLAQASILGGIRSQVGVPLLRERSLIGVIILSRQRVEPFTVRQIELLQVFADQAVIAIENTRLLTEQREALEQQTATAEVLQVINASPGDLAPVFDAMLDKAMALCGAAFGFLTSYDGRRFTPVAMRGVPPPLADYFRRGMDQPLPGESHYRILQGEDVIHNLDQKDEAAYRSASPLRRAVVDLGGARTALVVALRKDDAVLGALTIYRKEVRPFSDKQIELMKNFAAQAVIAIENARLLSEQREALEQQTATAEVLKVINSSPGNLQPVFDAMLQRAVRLSESAFGMMNLHENDRFKRVALHGVPRSLIEQEPSLPPPGPNNALSRLKNGEDVVHIEDLSASASYLEGDSRSRGMVELAGARSLLAVALRKDGVLLGSLTAYRQEVRPFSDKQIGLLQGFAAQAVIAMENARLLEELRDRQSELRVTFDNMGDGVAMFDAGHRLAAWNRNFEQIMGLSGGWLARRPSYAEYLELLADRGEFGKENVEAELASRLENTERELRLARTRADGSVIEVRRNAVPGGGFVLIYSDVTQQRRAEEAIRQARDAAETALKELKTAQASLVHAEKMASLGQLTAGIAHEIKNPLNFVNNFATLSVELLDELKETAAPALETLDGERRAEVDETIELLSGNLGKIAEHGKRADGIVKSMLAHSRGGTGDWHPSDINGLVEEALNLAYHGARAQDKEFNVTLERDFEKTGKPIDVVPQDITRVFLNLFGNGFYAANKRRLAGREAGFRPSIKVSTRDLGDVVEVRVRDNGTGIPPEVRERLFQPFFTTKPTGEGTGLGLSISYDIVTQQHGGTIAVESEPGAFTEFTVRLPRSRRPVAGRA